MQTILTSTVANKKAQDKVKEDSAQLKGGAEIIGGAVQGVARDANRDRYLPPKPSSGNSGYSNFLRDYLLVPGA